MALGRLSLLKSGVFLKIMADTFDDELKYLLSKASETACTLTNRALELATYEDEYYTPFREYKLTLNQYPVVSVSSVKFWDTTTEAWLAETATYYELINGTYIQYPKRGQESNATYGGFPINDSSSVQVSYTAGYSTAGWETNTIIQNLGVPYDLEWAVCGVACIEWALGRQDKGLLGIVTRSMGVESITYESFDKGIYPDKITRIFDRYVRMPIL